MLYLRQLAIMPTEQGGGKMETVDSIKAILIKYEKVIMSDDMNEMYENLNIIEAEFASLQVQP